MLFCKEIWNSRIWGEIFLFWMHLYANSLTLISRKQWCAILYNSSWRYCGNVSFYMLWNLSSLSTLLIVCVCVQAIPAAQPQPAQSSPTQSSERVVAKVSPWQDQDGCSMDIFNVPGVAPSPELFVCDDNDDSSSSSHEVSFPFYLVT